MLSEPIVDNDALNAPRPDEYDGNEPGKGRGDFFAVDKSVWRRACGLGLNPAVAFLVLARGSGGDQARTSWSTDAVERYTGISRHKAKAAIEALEKQQILELLRGGKKPVRRIRRSWEILGCRGYLGELTEEEQEMAARLPITFSHFDDPVEGWLIHPAGNSVDEQMQEGGCDDGGLEQEGGDADNLDCDDGLRELPSHYLLSLEEVRRADAIVAKGCAAWSYENGRDILVAASAPAAQEPDWIWLPNGLIDGVAGELPPIELLRQTGLLWLLRQFVELYHLQSLIRHGGVDSVLYHQVYEGKKLGTRGAHTIWAFEDTEAVKLRLGLIHRAISHRLPTHQEDGTTYIEDGWAVRHGDVFQQPGGAFYWLKERGLMDFVPCVYEGEDFDAEELFPLPTAACSVAADEERRLAEAGRAAAFRLMPKLGDAYNSELIYVPLPNHLWKPEVRGVFRMRYRPKTSATAQWMARVIDWQAQTAKFEQLGKPAIAE